MAFGRKMLEFRAKHNLTQKQLADIIGVDINTVHRTETEKTKPTLKGCFKCREIQVVSLASLPCCAECMGSIPTLIFLLLDWEGGDKNRVEEGNLS